MEYKKILKPKSYEEISETIKKMDTYDFVIKFRGQKIRKIKAKIGFKKRFYFFIYYDIYTLYKFIYWPIFFIWLMLGLCQLMFKNNDFLNSNIINNFKWALWIIMMTIFNIIIIVALINSKIRLKVAKKELNIFTQQIRNIMNQE